MHVRLKGINSVKKKLADGSTRTYWYAWKGGPKLDGKPGSPEFIASYNEAVGKRVAPRTGTLQEILEAYQRSSDFMGLAERTKRDYRKHILAIGEEFGSFPIGGLTDRRARGTFLAWRDDIATRSARTADYRFSVLARTMAWAVDRGLATVNPCKAPGRVYKAERSDAVWTDEDEAAFLSKAPRHLQMALTMALWTGQRQGDLIRLTWSAYDGEFIRLKQRKTGARVTIPVGAPLKALLDDAKAALQAREGRLTALTILTTEAGSSWTESGFRASWRKACAKAGVVGVTFHDLRGTAVTRLSEAGCTVQEIATLTGHSLKDAGAIIDNHYLSRGVGLAKMAMKKLEARTKTPN